MTLREFLETINPSGPWQISWGSAPTNHTTLTSAANAEPVWKAAQKDNLNTWFRFNQFQEATGLNGSVNAKDITAYCGFPLDIDVPGALKEGTETDRKAWRERVVAALSDARNPAGTDPFPTPTIITSSGNGIAAYYLFPRPRQLTADEYTRLLAGFQNAIIARDVPVDRVTKDPGRLFRVPFGKNFKYQVAGGYPTAEILTIATERHEPAYFVPFMADAPVIAAQAGGEAAAGLLEATLVFPEGLRSTPTLRHLVQYGADQLPKTDTRGFQDMFKDESRGVGHIVAHLCAMGNSFDSIRNTLLLPGSWTRKALQKHLEKPDPDREINRKLNDGFVNQFYPHLTPYMNLNRKFSYIRNYGGAPAVRYSEGDGRCNMMAWRPFQDAFHEYKLSVTMRDDSGEEKTKSVLAWPAWQSHELTYRYSRVDRVVPNERCPDGVLNTWKGWSTEPKAGDWSLMRKHILNGVCSGNKEHDAWLYNWLAWGIQKGGPMGSCVVLRGGEGTGKSTLTEHYGHLFNDGYTSILQAEHITGHNGVLANTSVLVLNEFFVGHHGRCNDLKGYCADDTITLRMMYKDGIPVRNNLRIFVVTNEEWSVRAGTDARRWFCLKVSDDHKQDFAHFAAIRTQMANGGNAAMLFDLLHHVIPSNFNPATVPITQEAERQKLLTLGDSETGDWLQELLTEGRADASVSGAYGRPCFSLRYMCKAAKGRYGSGKGQVRQELKDILVNDLGATRRHERTGSVWTPLPLVDCRRRYADRLKLSDTVYEEMFGISRATDNEEWSLDPGHGYMESNGLDGM